MSEKIEIGIMCSEFHNIKNFFSVISDLTKALSDTEIASISNRNWENYKKHDSNVSESIEAGLILIYSLNQELDIGAYQFKIKQGYVTELWLPLEYAKSKCELSDFVGSIVKRIKSLFHEMNVNFAYIGVESYVDYSDDLSVMKEKSSGVIQWIDFI